MGQGVAGSTSLPQLNPGPLAQGLVLGILPRAGTVHLKTPPIPVLSLQSGGAALPSVTPGPEMCVLEVTFGCLFVQSLQGSLGSVCPGPFCPGETLVPVGLLPLQITGQCLEP